MDERSSTPEGRGSEPMGTGQVHTRVSMEPGGGEQSTTDQARDKANQLKGKAQDKAGELKGQARQAADQARQRAGEMAGQARAKADDALHRAEDMLEERTHAVSRAQDNPVAALGIAFAVGFLLAGGDEDEEPEPRQRGGRGGRSRRPRRQQKGALSGVKKQLTGAVMGSLSAALTQQVKRMVEQGEVPGPLGDLADQFLGGKSQGGSRRGGGSQSAGQGGRTYDRSGSMGAGEGSTGAGSPIITDTRESMIGSRPV